MTSPSAIPSSPSVLIVDDDPDICQALKDLLEHEGYLVQCVSTGQEALARVTQQHFHAMTLDVGLPDQDGLSLLPVLKAADPLVPVLILSAHVTTERKAQALKLGAFAWFDKPYDREELKAMLRRAIGPAAIAARTEQVERRLLRSQIEQQALLELIPAMVWYKDTHNRVVRANRRAAESINKTVAEVEGQSTYDLYPEEAEHYYQDDLEVITSGRPKLGIVELYQTASGEKRWVQTDKVPYRDPQGHVIGVLVFAQDITERRQAEAALQESERQYRLLMEEASDGIVVLDLAGYFRMANAKVCDMVGYTREELLHLHVKDTYIPAEQALAQQRLEQVRAHKSVRFNRLLRRKDGTVIPVEISATKMSDDRYFGIVRDLPGQKLGQ